MFPGLSDQTRCSWHMACSAVSACVISTVATGDIRADTGSKQITAAIGRGAEYLLRTQTGDGAWNTWGGHELGETALAGMALLAARQPADSPSIVGAAEVVRRLAKSDTSTYDTSLAIMFLDRLGWPADEDLLCQLGARLYGGQCANGAWSYDLPRSSTGQPMGLGRFCGGGDNSNTQFAAIAAWISRRHAPRNDAALQRLDQYFRGTFQGPIGGWSYLTNGDVTPTMTCAGLVGLATHRGAEQQRVAVESSRSRSSGPAAGGPVPPRGAAADDPIAKRALEALGKELLRSNTDRSASINTDLYFFWSLERVGVIYDIRDIGGVDWYRWGSKRLIDGQSSDGQWTGMGSKGWTFDKNVGTSFAILFLSRANVAADLTEQVGSGGGVGADLPGLGGGSQLFQREGDGAAIPTLATPPAPPSQQRPGEQPKRKPEVGPGVLDPF